MVAGEIGIKNIGKVELSQQFNTISAITPTDFKRPSHASMTDKGIILNLEKPGDKNSFRVRKFSRNGSVSQRGDSEVRMEDDDAVKIEQLKQSIESEDEGGPKEKLVVQNRSLERGLKQARFSQQQTSSLVRDSLDNAVQLMRVNVELESGKQT
jgi:hypothetical protein